MQWIINARTVLEELPSEDNVITTKYDFTDFNDLGKLDGDSNNAFDIIGVVIEALPPRDVNNQYGPSVVQKFVIIDERVKMNRKDIAQFKSERSAIGGNIKLQLPAEQKFTLVANILPEQKTAGVKGKFSFQNILQKYYYVACKKCYQATAASYGTEYSCNMCKHKQIAEPRYRFDIDLIDESGTVKATVFGELAENILSYSAIEAMQLDLKGNEIDLYKVHESLESKVFYCQVKPSKTRKNESVTRYTLIYCSEEMISEIGSSVGIKLEKISKEENNDTNLLDATITVSETSFSKTKGSLIHKFNENNEDKEISPALAKTTNSFFTDSPVVVEEIKNKRT